MSDGKPLEDLLRDLLSAAPSGPFEPCAFHNVHGDLLEVLISDEPSFADRLNARITVHRSIEDRSRIVGVQVWGVSEIMRDGPEHRPRPEGPRPAA